MEEDDDLILDDVRDFLYVALRAQERQTENLRILVEDLDKRKEDDEWLEQAQEEAAKGAAFYDSQLQSWQNFSAKVERYIEAVRKEADEMAIEELQINKEDKKPGEEDGERKGRRAKTIHPELKKFKLEKQARILGKYGGVPAMGAGMVMAMMPRDTILKATASPAAREIQYSKVEGKDARYLAEVMQFKQRKARTSSDSGGQIILPGAPEPESSPWQAEVMGKKGQQYFKDHEAPAAPNTMTHTPYGNELADKLRQKQAEVAAAEAAAAAPKPKDITTPSIGSHATDELAEKLKRQQITLKHQEDEVAREAKAAAEAAAEAAHPSTPSANWSNPAAPFGAELSAALKQRSQQAAQQQQAAAAAAAAAAAEASPGFGFRTASNAIAGAGTPTPLRKPPLGGMATPAAGAASNELAELLKKRQARQAAEEAQQQ